MTDSFKKGHKVISDLYRPLQGGNKNKNIDGSNLLLHSQTINGSLDYIR